MITTLIFIIIAAICNALMDKVETTIQFNTSIFQKLRPEFWCKVVSADTLKFIDGTKYRPDAWHFAKSIMIILLLDIPVFYTPLMGPIFKPFLGYTYINEVPLNVILGAGFDVLIMGVVWNLTFDLFYHKIFYKPKIS